MTCVWKSLSSALKIKLKPKDLFNLVKKKNTMTTDIYWNGQPLTQLLYEQNLKDIKSLSVDDIKYGHGYQCSGCDPLFFLIAQIYKVSIVHEHYGHKTINIIWCCCTIYCDNFSIFAFLCCFIC